jgi:hypothetical protein
MCARTLSSTIQAVVGLLLAATPVLAQPSVPCDDTIEFSFEQATLYPSLRPTYYLRILPGEFQSSPFKEGWWRDWRNYTISVNGKPISEPLTLTWDKRQASIFVGFHSGMLKKGDKIALQVKMPKSPGMPDGCAKGIKQGVQPPEREVTVPDLSSYAATVEPSWLPKQELRNGVKRDVGHLDVKLDFPSLPTGGPRLYLKGNQVLSTDGKDKATQLEGILGATGALKGGWFIPWHVDAEILGDQTVDNGSFIASGGIRTILPWGWTRPLLWNGVVRAPFSPELEFSGQYERRLKQDAESLKTFRDPSAFRLFSQLIWSPIHLATGSGYSKEDVSVEFAGKGWFIPNQTNDVGRKFHRLEGYFATSLLVPVRKFALGAGLSPTGEGDAKQRIRLKYSYGANEAAGFKHVHQLSLGFEVVK